MEHVRTVLAELECKGYILVLDDDLRTTSHRISSLALRRVVWQL